MPWTGYLKQRLDKVKRIKAGIYVKPSLGTPWAVKSLQGATPKVDHGHEFFIQL